MAMLQMVAAPIIQKQDTPKSIPVREWWAVTLWISRYRYINIFEWNWMKFELNMYFLGDSHHPLMYPSCTIGRMVLEVCGAIYLVVAKLKYFKVNWLNYKFTLFNNRNDFFWIICINVAHSQSHRRYTQDFLVLRCAHTVSLLSTNETLCQTHRLCV